MTTMVEKMARAIENLKDENAPSYEPLNVFDDAEIIARAALTALLDPSSSMIDAGSKYNTIWGTIADGAALKTFQAMIRAALDEVG